jgi:glycosyltransferase involved in cell wall biosynthesis
MTTGSKDNFSESSIVYQEPKVPQSQSTSSLNLEQYDVIVVIPAFNEGRDIGSVLLRMVRYPVKIIVVDDGSSDDTSIIAEAAGATVIRLEKNNGKGVALNAGFHAARLLNPDVIVTFDGDGQHLATDLPAVIQPVLNDQADIVIGSRYLQPTSRVPRHRVLGHLFFNLLTSVASGVSVTDSQSGYRAFSRRAYNADIFHSTNFTVEAEMQFLAREHSLKVTEVPITIRYDDKPKRSVIGQGRMVLNGILRLMGQYRPLLFIGVPGAILLTVGILFGIWVVNIYSRIQTLAVGYAMISVLISIIGMLLLSTGIILHSIRALLMENFSHQRNL